MNGVLNWQSDLEATEGAKQGLRGILPSAIYFFRIILNKETSSAISPQ